MLCHSDKHPQISVAYNIKNQTGNGIELSYHYMKFCWSAWSTTGFVQTTAPWVKSKPLFVFVNKVLLESSCAHSHVNYL